MNEFKTEDVTDGTDAADCAEPSPEMVRRDFMKRFGVYAAGSAVGLYVLMSPRTARTAMGSDGAR